MTGFTEPMHQKINRDIDKMIIDKNGAPGMVRDGYHSFDELYDHRITLFIALCAVIQGGNDKGNIIDIDGGPVEVWRSKKHSDGELAFGGAWFVLGVYKTTGKQITYHLPIERWNETGFAEELETAPPFDGHTPADVLERLKKL